MSNLSAPRQIKLDHDGLVQKMLKQADKKAADAPKKSEFVRDVDFQIPDDIVQMCLWRILATPVRQRVASAGGILFDEETKRAQAWTHQMHKIAYVGPFVWSGKAYESYDQELLAKMRPKVGEIWLLYPKHPERLEFDGVEYVMLTDDALRGRVPPGTEHRYSFDGLST